jgi:competence ComEA-like helix-hairpin-helix protein
MDLDRRLLRVAVMSTSTSRIGARWHRLLASVLALWFIPLPASADAPTSQEAWAIHALLKPVVEGQLNINTATAEQWVMLPGIGPATAEKLVAYRERHPYRSVAHIMRVKGVGKKTYAAIRSYLTVDGETTLQASSITHVPVEPPAPW